MTQLFASLHLRFLMLVRYNLSLDDHLAWYDHCTASGLSPNWSSVPFIGSFLTSQRRQRFRRNILAAENQFAVGERALELSPSGIREFSTGFDFSTAWPEIAQIALATEHLFLAHSCLNAHIVPLRFFESPALRDAFVSFAFRHAPPSAIQHGRA